MDRAKQRFVSAVARQGKRLYENQNEEEKKI